MCVCVKVGGMKGRGRERWGDRERIWRERDLREIRSVDPRRCRM